MKVSVFLLLLVANISVAQDFLSQATAASVAINNMNDDRHSPTKPAPHQSIFSSVLAKMSQQGMGNQISQLQVSRLAIGAEGNANTYFYFKASVCNRESKCSASLQSLAFTLPDQAMKPLSVLELSESKRATLVTLSALMDSVNSGSEQLNDYAIKIEVFQARRRLSATYIPVLELMKLLTRPHASLVIGKYSTVSFSLSAI